MKECPACAGPAEARLTCATCNGKMAVSTEVFDAFMLQKQKQDEAIIFWNNVSDHLYKTGNFRFEANGQVFEITE